MGIDKRALAMLAVFAVFVAYLACAESGAFIVTDVRAAAISPGTVRINWRLPVQDASAFRVYKSASQFRDSSALTTDTFLAELPAGAAEFTDSRATVMSFYAVIALFGGKTFDFIVPSLNATISVPLNYVEPPSEEDEIPNIARVTPPIFGARPVPLPALIVSDAGIRRTKTDALRLPAREKTAAPARVMQPHIFPTEQTEQLSGERYLLWDIISKSFKTARYAETLVALNELLRVIRSNEVTARAEFYRGECSYFLGDYRAAIQSFILTKQMYPDISTLWFEAALEQIDIQ